MKRVMGYDIMDQMEPERMNVASLIPNKLPYDTRDFNPDDYSVLFTVDVCKSNDTYGIGPFVDKVTSRLRYLLDSCPTIRNSSRFLISARLTEYAQEQDWSEIDVFGRKTECMNVVRVQFGVNFTGMFCSEALRFLLKLQMATICIQKEDNDEFCTVDIRLMRHNNHNISFPSTNPMRERIIDSAASAAAVKRYGFPGNLNDEYSLYDITVFCLNAGCFTFTEEKVLNVLNGERLKKIIGETKYEDEKERL